MPTTFDGQCVKQQFEQAFGFSTKELNLNQLWFLTKLSKHIRQHCHHNWQFNDYMNRNFAPARFNEVSKIDPDNGKPCKGLEIISSGLIYAANDFHDFLNETHTEILGEEI